MTSSHAPSPRPSLLFAALALVSALCTPLTAQAERADRLKKMEVESDQPGKVDLQKQLVVFNGNVVVSKGTLLIRAARIEVRETDGYQYAIASGKDNTPATFRQKREGFNEFIEGEAERLEYDARADTVRFVNKAQVRRLRGNEVADEAHGALIVYDNAAEVFTVSGGAAAATPANPSGRIRVVLGPREGTAAAAEAASQAASAGGAR
jgi:lipopolysaccharide export system protein LptA